VSSPSHRPGAWFTLPTAATYGGYRIELLAGETTIGIEQDAMTPEEARFRDALITVDSDTVSTALLGQPLGIRLGISATQADRSTHFDAVRLYRQATAALGEEGTRFELEIWPNPVEDHVRMKFDFPARAVARVELFDPAGRQIRLLHEAEMEPGRQRLDLAILGGWSPLPSGIYFLRLSAGDRTETRKLAIPR